jgi:hypothetical protein
MLTARARSARLTAAVALTLSLAAAAAAPAIAADGQDATQPSTVTFTDDGAATTTGIGKPGGIKAAIDAAAQAGGDETPDDAPAGWSW